MMALSCTSHFDPPYNHWCVINDGHTQMYYNRNSDQSIPFERSMISFTRPKEIPPQIEIDLPHKAVIPTSSHDHILSKFTYLDEMTGYEYEEYIEPLIFDFSFPLIQCLDLKPEECHDTEDCSVSYR